ncbi:MAG: AAA family ATPase [bacterium]|nr:AAA family ATPase [bacterium]
MTGNPGVGKTTVVRTVASCLPDWHIRGFYTEEIREGGQRQGFRLVTFGEHRVILAHVDFHTPYRVSKYCVDISTFEAVVDSALSLNRHADVYLIDEIGKMECFSPKFITAVQTILDANQPVIAIVAKKGGGFISDVKQRADVERWEVTRENRTCLPGQAITWLRSLSQK